MERLIFSGRKVVWVGFGMLCVLGLVLFACSDRTDRTEEFMVTDELKQELSTLRGMSVFFGHQSVGMNIVDGIREVYARAGVGPDPIVNPSEAESYKGPGFYHVYAGKNGNPEGKCSDFEAQMYRLFPETGPDVAFLKFCYADFRDSTEAGKVLDSYVSTVARLQARYPSTRFIYVTVPVTARSVWWKRLGRSILGKVDPWDRSAVKRYKFNEALMSRVDRNQVFDLAKIESTLPSGDQLTFEYQGEKAVSINDAYTDDGGHLNELGRAVVAKALIEYVASGQMPRGN